MTIKKFLLSIGIVLVSIGLKSQDVHFTYFEMSPLTFNPAQTGAFSGTIRLSGHYRGQWLQTADFSTPAFSVDSPVMKGFRKYDWIGGGINFYQDNAGSLGVKSTGGGLNVAYHFAMDKNYSRVLSIGFKYGNYARSLSNPFNFDLRSNDGNSLVDYENSSLNGSFVIDQQSGGIDGTSKTDIGIGFLVKIIPDKTSQFELGWSVDHITSARTSFLGGDNNGNQGLGPVNPNDPPLDCRADPTNPRCQGTFRAQDRRHIRFTATSNYTTYLNNKLRISPGALMQFTKQGFEAQFHAIAGYLMDAKKGVIVNGGLGFRAIGLADAQLFFGVEMKDLKVGAAFDLGVLGFQQAPGFQGAFELGATYIIKIYKDPDVDPVIFCPRF